MTKYLINATEMKIDYIKITNMKSLKLLM